MKWLLFYTLSLFIILSYITLSPLKHDGFSLIEISDETLEQSQSILNTDVSPILAYQIETYDLVSHVTHLSPKTYIIPSTNPHGVYQKDHSYYFLLDRNTSPTVIMNGDLFKGSDDAYYLVISYSFDYQSLGNLDHQLQLRKRHDQSYQFIAHDGFITYQDHIYKRDAFESLSSNHTFYYNKKGMNQAFKNPTYTGYLILRFDELLDDFLSLDVDFYEAKSTNSGMTIGFNTFKKTRLLYIPQTISLTYEEDL